MHERIRLGVSTCLLGGEVRYDGQHKLDRFIRDTLGRYVDLVPVCPEVECGLGVPREAMRLVGDLQAPRLVTVKTGIDHTDRMLAWARMRVRALESEDLCGYVFKSKSPSSGMARVKVYDEDGVPRHAGVGLFARVFMDHFPLLPVEEEGRLHDLKLRETFVESVFTLMRWRQAMARGRTPRSLVEFHSSHKLLIMSHSETYMREMGKLVAAGQAMPAEERFDRYQELLLRAVRLPTTVHKNVNVMQHAMGYFRKVLSADEKQEMLETLTLYQDSVVPLVVPITLLKHYVRKYDQPYLRQQLYLTPHPLELQLRNHV